MVYENSSVPNLKTIMPPINVKNLVLDNEENSSHLSVRPSSRNRKLIRHNVYKSSSKYRLIVFDESFKANGNFDLDNRELLNKNLTQNNFKSSKGIKKSLSRKTNKTTEFQKFNRDHLSLISSSDFLCKTKKY